MYKIPFLCLWLFLFHLLLIKYVLWFAKGYQRFLFSDTARRKGLASYQVWSIQANDLMQSLKRRRRGGEGTPKYAEMSILYDTKRGKNLINGNAKQGLIDYFTIIARTRHTISFSNKKCFLFKSCLTWEEDSLIFSLNCLLAWMGYYLIQVTAAHQTVDC